MGLRHSPEQVRIVNLEDGRPTVAEARARLLREIERARKEGAAALKVIHGYGSSGEGGALQGALRRSLRRRKKEGLIAAIVYGERWEIFDETTREVIERCPALGDDCDLNRYNEGITIVLL